MDNNTQHASHENKIKQSEAMDVSQISQISKVEETTVGVLDTDLQNQLSHFKQLNEIP